MPLGWKIEYTPPGGAAGDISALVAGFSITASLEAYCRELTVDVIDRAFFDALDFSIIPQAPALEVFTRTDSAWESQGKFFIERPVFAADPDSDAARGIWGRSATAAAGEPFAARITQSWEADTTFYAVAAEMCAAAGLPWQDSDADIDDFVIFAGTYTAEKKYPIEILQELAKLAGALVSCDRTGHLRIRAIDYAPAAADISVDDAVIRRLTVQPRYPRFGNRVKIIPTGSTSGYRLRLYVPDACIDARSAFTKAVYARVTDSDGKPVAGAVVDWSLTFAGTGTQGLAGLAVANGNTGSETIFNERQRAESFYRVKTSLPPATVLGIHAEGDVARRHNLVSGGYSIEDGTIVLADALAYCDQALVIDYTADGIAVNALLPAGAPGTNGQSATLTASVGGVRDTADIYINNPCHCPISLALTAKPSSINIHEESRLLVYAEASGGPVTDGRQVFLSQQNRVGFLKATLLRLAAVAISDEPVRAVNVVAGITQCDVSMWPSSVYAVYAADDDGKRSGPNLYASHMGKRINLAATLTTGTNLLVSYYALGAAVTTFRGGIAGTAHIRAQIRAHTEAPVEAAADITVADPVSPVDDNWTPPGWDPWSEPAWDDPGYYGDDSYEEPDPGGDGDTETDCATLCDTQKSDCEKACAEQYPGGGQGYDDCMTACGNDYDSCSSDCTAANDPAAKDGKWDPQFEETTCNGATCGENERCCAVGTDFDCRTDQACADAQGSSYGGTGDDCDAACADELNRYGTTRVFDDGSMRTIDQIVRQDYGYTDDSSAQYWDKYNALATQAQADCVEACQGCAAAAPITSDAPETLAPGQSAIVTISGGSGELTVTQDTAGVAGQGFSLAALAGNQMVIDQAADGCGSGKFVVSDACGHTHDVIIRSTSGIWVFKGHICGLPGPVAPDYADCAGAQFIYSKTEGNKYQYQNMRASAGGIYCDRCGGDPTYQFCGTAYDQIQCLNPNEMNCSPLPEPCHGEVLFCWCGELAYKEWECL